MVVFFFLFQTGKIKCILKTYMVLNSNRKKIKRTCKDKLCLYKMY